MSTGYSVFGKTLSPNSCTMDIIQRNLLVFIFIFLLSSLSSLDCSAGDIACARTNKQDAVHLGKAKLLLTYSLAETEFLYFPFFFPSLLNFRTLHSVSSRRLWTAERTLFWLPGLTEPLIGQFDAKASMACAAAVPTGGPAAARADSSRARGVVTQRGEDTAMAWLGLCWHHMQLTTNQPASS